MDGKYEKEDKVEQQNINKNIASANNHIRRVVAILSEIGGVENSFVTGLLACALAKKGYRTGILDANINGSDIPRLFGLNGPVGVGVTGNLPLQSRMGIKIISLDLLLSEENQPVIQRVPLINKAIHQLWGELDFLLILFPPGTSNAALTILQTLPVKGILYVTIPQRLAGMIGIKTVHLARNAGVPITRVIENLANFRSPDNGKQNFIFDPDNNAETESKANTPMLVQIPFDPEASRLCDEGKIEELELVGISSLLDPFIKEDLISPSPDNSKGFSIIQDDISTAVPNRPKRSIYLANVYNEENHGSISKLYSPKALALMKSRENYGTLEKPDARGMICGKCGDSMQIDLRLGGEVIQDALYTTNGCGATIACGSMVTQLAKDKSIYDALLITPEELIEALDGLPEDHRHCSVLAVSTLQQAIENAIETQGSL